MATNSPAPGGEQDRRPWHPCVDCFSPLADDLREAARSFRRPFDVNRYFSLNHEYGQLSAAENYGQLTGERAVRGAEISEQLEKLGRNEPADSSSIERLYQKHHVEVAVVWLKINVSTEFGREVEQRLESVRSEMWRLEFRAMQVLQGTNGNSVTGMRYPIKILQERYYSKCRQAQEKNPNFDPDYADDSLPEEVRRWNFEILEPYDGAVLDLEKVAKYLKLVSAVLTSKIAKSADRQLVAKVVDDDEDEERTEAELSLEAKAMAMLIEHPEWSDTRIAKELGCHRTSLYRFRTFTAARELQKKGREKYKDQE